MIFCFTSDDMNIFSLLLVNCLLMPYSSFSSGTLLLTFHLLQIFSPILCLGVLVVAQWLTSHNIMRTWVQSLTLLSGLRIWHCCELQHRLQMRLRSHIAAAVAVASSCNSCLTPGLGTSICQGYGPKRKKERKKKWRRAKDRWWWWGVLLLR